MIRTLTLLSTLLTCFLAIGSSSEAQDAPVRRVRLYILAGQSNMEGKAQNKLLDYQATAPETAEFFAHLRDGDQWITRDDVFIQFLERRGPLTVGYGSPNRTGLEFELGYVLGEAHSDPVLLIKTAWGGHSLFKDFRPPSSGMPSDEALDQEWKQAVENTQRNNERNNRNDEPPTREQIVEKYGRSYRMMVEQVDDMLANYATYFPELEGAQIEVSGFVWFQGWNDQYGSENEYEGHMANFVRDVRAQWNKPELPFVIGVMGQNGSKPAAGAMKIIQDAQEAVAAAEEFKATTRAVRTDVLVDTAAEELFPTWRDNVEAWEKVGSDFGYHYYGSGIWFTRIGHELGEALLELEQAK